MKLRRPKSSVFSKLWSSEICRFRNPSFARFTQNWEKITSRFSHHELLCSLTPIVLRIDLSGVRTKWGRLSIFFLTSWLKSLNLLAREVRPSCYKTFVCLLGWYSTVSRFIKINSLSKISPKYYVFEQSLVLKLGLDLMRNRVDTSLL